MPSSIDANSTSRDTDLRLLRTRKALRDGLLSLLKNRSLSDITVREISKESLVGYNTFFRHYKSKDELLEEIIAEEFTQLAERSMPALVEAETRSTALAICNYVNEHRELWAALLGGDAQAAGRATPIVRNILTKYSLALNVRTLQHEWLPVDLGAIFGVGAVLDILSWWLSKWEQYSVEQVAELLDRLVLTPMLARHDPGQ